MSERSWCGSSDSSENEKYDEKHNFIRKGFAQRRLQATVSRPNSTENKISLTNKQ